MIFTFELTKNVDELELDPVMQAEILVNKVTKDTWLVVACTTDIIAEIICIPEDSWWTDVRVCLLSRDCVQAKSKVFEFACLSAWCV